MVNLSDIVLLSPRRDVGLTSTIQPMCAGEIKHSSVRQNIPTSTKIVRCSEVFHGSRFHISVFLRGLLKVSLGGSIPDRHLVLGKNFIKFFPGQVDFVFVVGYTTNVN